MFYLLFYVDDFPKVIRTFQINFWLFQIIQKPLNTFKIPEENPKIHGYP